MPTIPQLCQHARHEMFLTAVCVVVATCLNLCGYDISEGVLPQWLGKVLPLGHHGFVCPFCGGTRAFVYVLRGDFRMAVRCSLLGTLVTMWLLATFPLRLWFLLCQKAPLAERFFSEVKHFECADHFLLVTAGCFVIQLALHFSGVLPWLPFVQLLTN